MFGKKEDSDIRENKNVICVDREFDDVVRRDIKIMISTAFIILEANMRKIRCDVGLSELSISLIKKKASQMKLELNNFIDSQVNRIIDDSKVQEQSGCQVPE